MYSMASSMCRWCWRLFTLIFLKSTMKNHRSAAVAGVFYPGNPEKLENDVKTYMRSASRESQQPVKFIVAPHAGYSYSGEIAGEAYSEISNGVYERIMLLGPSHRYYFKDIAEF